MKKERLTPRSKELLREMMGMYQPKTVGDIQNMLKDLFADTMEDMLKAELDEELGYAKNSQQPKTTGNRRNGSYPKTVKSNIGEIEVNIPRDRDGEYEPERSPKAQRTSAVSRKRCCRCTRKAPAIAIFQKSLTRSTAFS